MNKQKVRFIDDDCSDFSCTDYEIEVYFNPEGDINICQDNVSIHNDGDSQSIGLTIESLKEILEKMEKNT